MNEKTEPIKISDEERQKRQAAFDIGRGSVRLEGFIVSPEAEALNAKYINGEITSEDVIAGLDKLYKK